VKHFEFYGFCEGHSHKENRTFEKMMVRKNCFITFHD